MSGYVLVIEGSERFYTTAGVDSVTSFSDAFPTGATIAAGILGRLEGTLTERLAPTEGELEVSGLDFALHDTDEIITAAWTLDEDSIDRTFMTAAATAGDTTLNVADSAAIGATPRVIWVGGEAMLASAAPTATTLTVQRGYLGTRARPLEYDAGRAQVFEVLAAPLSMVGRRVKLYRMTSATGCTLRWVGYVRRGPTLAENGGPFMVSCVHAWEQEGESTLAAQEPAATLYGYDAQGVTIVVNTSDRAVQGFSRFSNAKARVFARLTDAVRASVDAVTADLDALGATDAFGTVGVGLGGALTVKVQFQGLSLGTATLTIAGQSYTATSTDASGYREHVWTVPAADTGAVVRVGFALGSDERATVITPHVGLRTTNWTASAGSVAGVSITPLLLANLSDEHFLELDPSGHSPGGPVYSDTTFTENGNDSATGVATFRGFARLVPRDPTARAPAADRYSAYRNGLPVAEAVPLHSGLKVSAPHWLDAVRSVLEDDTHATAGSDDRNWSWDRAPQTRRRTGGDAAAVELRFSGDRTVRETLTGLCKLRGACVSVRGGLLTITSVVEPRASDTPAATFTDADLIAGRLPLWGQNDEGVVTSVTIETPLRAVTVRDARATQAYGQQRNLEVTAAGMQRDERWTSNPVDAALRSLGPLLSRWSRPVYRHSITVPASEYERAVQLGDVVSFASYVAPNGSGSRGFTGKRAVVIGRTEDFATNTLSLDLLVFPVAYGFAPAARVASISGAVLTLASAYAGDAGDYAGSGLTGYERTASDKGAGWFSAGDAVRLVLGDSAAYTTESYEVASVDTAAGTITLTASVATVPTDWPFEASAGIVYVTFDDWASASATQRVFAAVSDETTRTIGGTSDVAKRWAP